MGGGGALDVIHVVDAGGITATTDQGCQSVVAAIRTATQGRQVINGFSAKRRWVAAMVNLQVLSRIAASATEAITCQRLLTESRPSR
jgi:hypothetical protein